MAIETSKDLDDTIAALERKRVIQKSILKQQFNETIDHYKPKNLIKGAIKSAFDNKDGKGAILKTVGRIGAGFLAKNLVLGSGATTIVGKIVNKAIKAGALTTILNNSDKIKAWGTAIYKNLAKKK